MAALGQACESPSPSGKSVSETPEKVRQLLSDSIAETTWKKVRSCPPPQPLLQLGGTGTPQPRVTTRAEEAVFNSSFSGTSERFQQGKEVIQPLESNRPPPSSGGAQRVRQHPWGEVVRQRSDSSIDDQSTSINESPDDSGAPGLPVPCDSANKEAFFSRVESFTSFKWAGMSYELSPLHCAKYGWTNVECDVLKCSSCQAFLCTTLHPLLDINKYKERVAGLHDSLKTAHEKFCFWPDSPCPDRFWALPLNEPAVLLHGMGERFKSLCLLDIQLPVLKEDDLKEMTIGEETISFLLQLMEDELKSNTTGDSPVLKCSEDLLSVHVSACALALSGWAAGSSSDFHHLPIITCSYCMRKVGLWSFQQIDAICSAGDTDHPVCSTSLQVNKSETSMPTPPAMSSRRMITRSQDAAQTNEQHETSPLPIGARTRSRDAHSPTLVDRSEPEPMSPQQRNKRSATRSMGQGDVSSSPQRKPKRLRRSSSTSSESNQGYFNPVSQHRDWCPWIKREMQPEGAQGRPEQKAQNLTLGPLEQMEPGWKAVLEVLLSLKGSSSPNEGLDSFSLSEKSKKVFRIFRQWQVPCSV